MRIQIALATFFSALLFTASPGAAEGPTDLKIAEFVAAAGKARGAPPSYAVVVVSGGRAMHFTSGRAGWPAETHGVDAHSSFYIASVTKSYVGLLAAKLDREGVFRLDTTIADAWPELRLPEEADARKITLRDLLSHSSGLNNPALNFRLENLSEPDAGIFRKILETETKWVGSEFRYSNFGYLFYVHLLERKTGRSWREWLKSEVLVPLSLNETLFDPEDAPPGRLVLGHQLGPDGWVALAPKDRETMHGAGGLYTSPDDAAVWLKANLEMSGLPPEVYRLQRTAAVATDAKLPGRICTGYGLGLMICQISGAEIYGHFGSYSGWRTSMSFMPSRKAGVYVLAASDHMAQMWAMLVENQIFDLLLTSGSADAGYEQLKAFEAEAAKYLAERTANRRRGLARIAARKWEPAASVLKSFEAHYEHPALGTARITADGGDLKLVVGAYQARLVPVEPGVFILMDEGVTVEDIKISPKALIWGDDVFAKVN